MLKILFVLLLTVQVLLSYPTLSLYHTSGTTFLNLRKFSQKFSLQIKDLKLQNTETFDLLVNETEKYFDATSQKNNTGEVVFSWKEGDNENWIKFYNSTTVTGNVDLTITSSFFDSPNGESEKQGWILKDSDYLTPSQLEGKSPFLQKWYVGTVEPKLLAKKRNLSVNVNLPEEPLKTALNLIINVFRPINRKHMVDDEGVKRRKGFSKAFLKRILKKDSKGDFVYKVDQLYNDYLIRETLASLKFDRAFSLSIEKARKIFFELKDVSLPIRAVEIYPLLINLTPEDEVSKKFKTLFEKEIVGTEKYVQFNEFEDELEIDLAVRRSVGLVKVTEVYGQIVADKALSEVSYFEDRALDDIRRMFKKNPKARIIFKYSTLDPLKCPLINGNDFRELEDDYKDQGVIYSYINTNEYGISPLIIPGESIVYHQRTEHRFNFLGKYNVALINFNLAHLMEQKWFEFKYFSELCGETFMPKTEILSNLISKDTNPYKVSIEEFVEVLKKHFPNGFVAKGAWDYNGDGAVLHHMRDYVKLYYEYTNSTFRDYVVKLQTKVSVCEPIEDLYEIIKPMPHFLAWKVERLLNNSYEAIIQEFMPIFREERVECNCGQCPVELMNDDEGRSQNDTKEERAKYHKTINDWFVKCVNSIPEKLRGIPLTADVPLLVDGRVVAFETNPGGNSWLLHNSPQQLKPHNAFLKQFPELVAKNPTIYNGMTAVEQMEFVKNKIFNGGWKNVDAVLQAKRFNFLRDRITDEENVKPHVVNLKRMNSEKRYPAVRKAPYLLFKKLIYLKIEGAISYLSKKIDTNYDFLFILTSLKLYTTDINEETMKEVEAFFQKVVEKDVPRNLLKDAQSLTESISQKYAKSGIDGVTNIKSLIDDVFYLQRLNVPCEESKILLSKLVSAINLNEKYKKEDISKLLFSGYDIFDVYAIEKIIIDLKRNAFSPSSSFKVLVKEWLEDYIDSIYTLYSLERSGYKLQNLTLSSVLKHWIPIIRQLYPYALEYQNKKFNLLSLVVDCTVEALNLLSDFSIWTLPKQTYALEYNFLRDVLVNKKPITNHQKLDTVNIFSTFGLSERSESDDEKLLSELNDIKVQILENAKSNGGFGSSPGERADLKSTFKNLNTLIPRENSISTPKSNLTEIGDVVEFDEYKERLIKSGMMEKPTLPKKKHVTLQISTAALPALYNLAVKRAFQWMTTAVMQLGSQAKDQGVNLDYVHSVSNFLYMDVSYGKEQKDLLHSLLENFRKNQNKVIDPVREKIKKFNQDFGFPKEKYNRSEVDELGQFYIGKMEDMVDPQILGFEHNDIREQIAEYNKVYLEQVKIHNYSKADIGKSIFKNFDLYDPSVVDKHIDKIIEIRKSGKITKSDKAIFNSFHKLETLFIDVMGAIHAAKRTGFVIPEVDFAEVLKLWIPHFRRAYPLFQDYKGSLKPKSQAAETYISLQYLVTHILYSVNDFSLFKLPVHLYEPEYSFLVKSLKHQTDVLNNVDITGEIIDNILLFDGDSDPYVAELIENGRLMILSKQTDVGGFPEGENENDIHAAHTCVTALIDHKYADRIIELKDSNIKDIGDFASHKDFVSRLRRSGLMTTNYKFFDETLRDDYVPEKQTVKVDITGN